MFTAYNPCNCPLRTGKVTGIIVGKEEIELALLPVPWDAALAEESSQAGDADLTPGLERSPREGNVNPLQDSCLGNPMDREAWRVTVHRVMRVGQDLKTKPPPPCTLGKHVGSLEPSLIDYKYKDDIIFYAIKVGFLYCGICGIKLRT